MRGTQYSDIDLDRDGLAMLVGDANQRVRDLLAMIEVAIRQTQSTSVKDYRAQLMARISELRNLHAVAARSGAHSLKMTDLVERTLRPYCTSGARVIASGADLLLQAKLALALHLVFNELAMNAKKYGALSCPDGNVEIQWKIRHTPGASRKLAVVWTERGGPEVKSPRRRGFGSRLLKRALEGYGGLRLDFNRTGLACFMLIDLDPAGTPMRMMRSPQTVPEFHVTADVTTS
jgi:two-component sensor histidine kinase